MGSLVNVGTVNITSNTTAGVFELPNYAKGELSGPVMEEDLFKICGDDCEAWGWLGKSKAPRSVDLDANA